MTGCQQGLCSSEGSLGSLFCNIKYGCCNVTANKLRCELGTTASDLTSITNQLNATSQALLEMEKTLRGIQVMVKNRPILKNANIRG